MHYCAEMVSKGEMVDKKAIEEYIDMHDEHEDYDKDLVRDQYPMMAETLVNYYVLEHEMLEAEVAHLIELIDG